MAKREFSKVSPAIWRSDRFQSLKDSDSKLLQLYFITSSHQNSAGAYAIPMGYACSDLGWNRNRYESALHLLVESGLVAYDDETETVYVEQWFVHNPPMNEKHAVGTRRLISEIDSDTIREKVEVDFENADDRRTSKGGPAYGAHLTGTGLLNGRR